MHSPFGRLYYQPFTGLWAVCSLCPSVLLRFYLILRLPSSYDAITFLGGRLAANFFLACLQQPSKSLRCGAFSWLLFTVVFLAVLHDMSLSKAREVVGGSVSSCMNNYG